MPLPESPRVIFGKNPLAEVICQLRFPPILAITAESPADFQQRVRQSYPLYSQDHGLASLPKDLAPLLARVAFPQPAESLTHKFSSEDGTRSISLAQEFFAVTEQRYARWENFRREVALAEEACRQVYEPPFYTRVGLRYQDVLDRGALGLDSVSWNELISPSFAGLLGAREVADDVRETQSVVLLALGEVEGGSVRIRHGQTRPADDGRQRYVIDADFFTEERCTHDRAFQILDVFNRLARNLFRWAITERLEHALEPHPLG